MINFQRRKGFSLTEIIVSMALVVMISAIGFLACVVSIKISSNSALEVNIYNDFEKFGISLSSAYNGIDGDYNKKDEFIDSFMRNLEWYFDVDGLADKVREQSVTGDNWTIEIPIQYGEINKDGKREVIRSISVYYYGATKTGMASYAYLVTVKGSEHYSGCNVNCRTADFGALLKGYRNNSNIAFYEKDIHLGNA